MSALESRRLLAAVFPTANEQYLVELINRGRANPTAEATRYGIALNEGVPSNETISTTPKQPLAINPFITDAARKHSQWMIDTDTFAHNETTASGTTDPGQRMTNAGYAFAGSWTWGENIAWNGTTADSIDAVAGTAQLHSDLFIDKDYPDRGHRTNLMNGAFREIGPGVVTGSFQGYTAVMGTEDFGTSGSSVFLTGVAYDDAAVKKDNFYTPGEGLGGITVTATRTTDNQIFSTTTWASGGYSLALPAGTYNVVGSGGAIGGNVTYGNVTIGTQNVKKDFTPAQADPFATISNGKLRIVGTTGADTIAITFANNAYTITRNTVASTLSGTGVTGIDVFAYDGNDYITLGAGVIGTYVDAGAGNDYIVGGDFADTITGGAGKDLVVGNLGDDRLNGNGGHDQLFGGAGKDRLYGGDGYDTLDGGPSTDRLWGNDGNNTYYGQGGDDYLYTRNSLPDTLYGQSGTDHAQVDPGLDTVYSVEDLLA